MEQNNQPTSVSIVKSHISQVCINETYILIFRVIQVQGWGGVGELYTAGNQEEHMIQKEKKKKAIETTLTKATIIIIIIIKETERIGGLINSSDTQG